MFHKLAAVFLIDQSGLVKPSRMLADSFFIRAKRFNNVLQCYAVLIGNEQQYLNTIMIRYSLKVPLHLFCCLNFAHIHIVLHHTNILKFIRMFLVGFGFFGVSGDF